MGMFGSKKGAGERFEKAHADVEVQEERFKEDQELVLDAAAGGDKKDISDSIDIINASARTLEKLQEARYRAEEAYTKVLEKGPGDLQKMLAEELGYIDDITAQAAGMQSYAVEMSESIAEAFEKSDAPEEIVEISEEDADFIEDMVDDLAHTHKLTADDMSNLTGLAILLKSFGANNENVTVKVEERATHIVDFRARK